MDYITQIPQNKLMFVICAYQDEMIYHDYEYETDVLSAGKSLTTESAKTLFNFVNNVEGIKDYSFSGITPKNIIKHKTDEKYVVWETPAGIKNIIYKKELAIKSGEYYVPRLLWKLSGKKLCIWALLKDVESEKDKLYNAPFFNIYTDGSICMGSAKFLENSYDYAKIISKAEGAFWDSTFTHSNNDQLLIMNFTNWCNDEKLKKSNCEDLLVDSGKNIKEIL